MVSCTAKQIGRLKYSEYGSSIQFVCGIILGAMAKKVEGD
jgi:hypothetical protein